MSGPAEDKWTIDEYMSPCATVVARAWALNCILIGGVGLSVVIFCGISGTHALGQIDSSAATPLESIPNLCIAGIF